MIGLQTVRRGERVALWNANGEVRYVDGPRRIVLWRERVEPLRHYSAESHQYLKIRYADGREEHRRGPAEIWFDPVLHESVTLGDAIAIDAHEALVIYARQTDEAVTRRVLRGPAQYVPQANEWLHEFSWHGAVNRHTTHKTPHTLQFTKLRVIPDQMYFDVTDVRTADDALLAVKLMVFFELTDIERMLDQTHDPIADFINALAADVVDFAARRSFEQCKLDTHLLNELAQYPNLTARAARIGYQVNKVVYRGYVASDSLQAMHDHAIESRTQLKLEAETERQAQELADLKLDREAERDKQRRKIERSQTEHNQQMLELQHNANLARDESEHRQIVEHKRASQAADVEHLRNKNDEELRFLHDVHSMQVDVTRYLVAQFEHPDRLIKIEPALQSKFHIHES